MVYQTLKEEIFNGTHKFGDKLVISRLAERFGSSEIPVREAISLLESDKLIEFKPHIGAIVSTLTSKDIQEIFELRVELEGLATRLAVEGMNEQILQEIRMIMDESITAYEENNYELYEELNVKFHNKIYDACDNQLLIRTISDLWSNTKRYPSLFKGNIEHIKSSIQEHEDIYNAIVSEDSMLAESFMIKHKTRAGKEILRLTQLDFYSKLNSLITNKN